jgi:hypothetical protein
VKTAFSLIIYLIVCYSSFGQKTKTEKIWSASFGVSGMNAVFSIDDQGKQSLEKVWFYGRDSRFTQLVEYVDLFDGSPSDLILWLKQIIAFGRKEEPGTSLKIDGGTVSISKNIGGRYINIFPANEAGYHSTYIGKLESALDGLNEWVLRNKINLRPDTTLRHSQVETKISSPKKEPSSVADELTKLKKLMDEGVLTKEEFEAQKKKLLEN